MKYKEKRAGKALRAYHHSTRCYLCVIIGRGEGQLRNNATSGTSVCQTGKKEGCLEPASKSFKGQNEPKCLPGCEPEAC